MSSISRNAPQCFKGSSFLINICTATESRPLDGSKAAAQRKKLEAMLESYGREARPAHLPPSDSMTVGGKYNISACGPEGQWPQSSGVWVPWRREPLATHLEK